MNFFVISDTHGKLDKVYEIFETLEGIDAIIHLGDYARDAEDLKRTLNIDMIAVKGNTDGACSPGDFKILNTECGNLYLSHGHLENVKMHYKNIYYSALEHGCVAALFGHTHKPIFEQTGDIFLVNPGSLTLPADGTKGSYILLNTSPAGITGSVVYYKETEKKPPAATSAPKVQGGYLRGLLNYSDRF